MSELAVYEPGASAMERASDFATWAPKLASAAAIAREVSQTDFVPSALRGSTAAVTAAILAGSEMGLGPMTSLMHVHIIEGRPSLSSEMQRALVLAIGHHIRYREMTVTRCVVDGQRRGETEWTTVSWSLDDAKRAGLDGRQNWRRYPRRMLAARATGELCRMLFADALAGMPYSAEELEDEADDTAASTGQPEQNGEPPKQRTARRKTRADNVPGPDGPAPDRPGPADTQQSVQGAGPGMPPLPGEDEPPPKPDDDLKHRRIVGVIRQHFTRLGFTDDERDQRLIVTARLAGIADPKQLTTTTALTTEQASAVADTLARVKNRDKLIELLAAGEDN